MKTIARLLGGGLGSDLKMMEIYNFEDSIAQVNYIIKTSNGILQFLSFDWFTGHGN